MFSFRPYKRAIIIIMIVFVLDFFIRAFYYHQIKTVVAIEAVLFLITSIITFFTARKDKVSSLKAERFDLWLALFFLLGGIRSALWTLGANIFVANITILVLGIIIGIFLLRWWNKIEKNN
jgi:hypothetical protein